MISPAQVFKNIFPKGGVKPTELSSLTWTVAGDLPYLNGHFPNSPILPAIAILDASTYILQQVLAQPQLTVKVVQMAKFLNPIVPGQTVRIAWQSLNEKEWQIDWKDAVSENSVATLRVQL
jgi:3-hydroxymyristoyl/3-hydroxydecanoyl-(acyl carrier protein) dehydratase